MYLARCYAPLKRYAEALTLIQHGSIHIRETNTTLSLLGSDPITTATPSYFPLQTTDVQSLEGDLVANSLRIKRDWFAYNGGSLDADGRTYKKPLFFNIALNYVELDMDRLLTRAGKQPAVSPPPVAAPPVERVRSQSQAKKPAPVISSVEKKSVSKAVIEEARPATPESKGAPARGGISSLLGGWWGKS